MGGNGQVQPRVRLTELQIVVATCELYGYEVADDWAGEPSVSLDDAARETTRRRVESEEYERRWAAHQADVERWVEGRSAAARKARDEASDKATRRGEAPGGAAHEAALTAAEHYERSVPRPLWNGQASIPLGFVPEVDAGRPIRAAIRSVLGVS